MEAHAGSISIGTRVATRPRPRRLQALRARLRARRADRIVRTHGVQANGGPRTVPGSEHTHLILPPKAY
jgi:hypothetical protein